MRWSEDQYRAHLARQADFQRYREGQMLQEPPVSEKVFQDAVVRLAKQHGWMAYHTWSSKRSPEGFPDLVLAKAGQPLYVCELKREDGQVTLAQQAWLAALGACTGVVAEIWRPKDLEEICRQLRG
jgi:hypothetical protein